MKGGGRNGMRVATTAGMAALGLSIAGAGVAGAATRGTTSEHPHHSGPSSAHRHGRPIVFGTVLSVGARSFVVSTHSGSKFIVNVTNDTTYRDHGVTSPSFSDIKVGEMVIVFGPETSGKVAATSVGIGTPGGR
jgi:hypothetical protein